MSEIILSGTSAVRYPDPLIRRTNPNGTQEFTSYQAFYCYFDAEAGVYQFILGYPTDGMVTTALLFGSDYPSIVTPFSQYEPDTYSDTGVLNAIRSLAFPESIAPGIGGIDADIVGALFADPFNTTAEYKEITPRNGRTLTNNVEVQGFQYLVLANNHNLWHTPDGGVGDNPERAAFALQLNVTLNGATTHSTSPFASVVDETLRIPVILFEGDFTQAIKDSGYILENVPIGANFFGATTATLDIVGIFGTFGYQPGPPSPTPVPPEYGAFPYNSYQARFAAVTVDGGVPSVELLNINSTVDDRGWPSRLLMFSSGAPTVINQYLDPSQSTTNAGNSLFLEEPIIGGTYTVIPASTRQTMLTPLVGTDDGWILSGPVTVPYQGAASGLTVTNAVQVTGYFVYSQPLQREIIYYYEGGEYTQASGALIIALLGKGQVNGPSLYFSTFGDVGANKTIPIVVNESTFGEYNLEPGYYFVIGSTTYVVVGLWAAQAPAVAARFAAPLSEPAVERNTVPMPAPEPTPPLDIKALFAETGAKLRARQRR